MVNIFYYAVDLLAMVGSAFLRVWGMLFFCAFLVLVIDVFYYQFFGGDRK